MSHHVQLGNLLHGLNFLKNRAFDVIQAEYISCESLSYDDPERTNGGLVAVVFKEPKLCQTLSVVSGALSYMCIFTAEVILILPLPIRILRTGCEVLLLDNIAWVPLLVFLIYEVSQSNQLNALLREVLVQDGLYYYLCIITLSTISFCINVLNQGPLPHVLFVLESVIHNSLCIRLSFHLFKVVERNRENAITLNPPRPESS
ncbi:hypothetical protein PNOK_0659400 [Pyrrhoderma noxium]|uniref:Uncharacterized protein n=1 Tax=Pyrrhoderma noxium TaxID=2282107 RepID=A0A286UEY2_9AGAM|nr:hypothetical protein PNOK_0659400 [Pyrrhoderma noxium]